MKKQIHKILCFLGIHNWKLDRESEIFFEETDEHCIWCGKKEIFKNY